VNDHCEPLGYYPFSRYLKERYGCKVHKVSLHAGFTCPNRDGRAGTGGCTYCANESFNPQAGKPPRPIREQMADGIAYMRRRFHAKKFMAYFQAFSNTYAPVERLRALYDEAAAFPDVVGLSIGTRPDCVPDDVLDLVQSYTDRLEVWLEYGVQSAHDRTLQRINRGHDFAAFRDAVERTRGRGIRICAHVILGLPGESHGDMMETAEALQRVGIDGIKIHHLYVARGTALEAEYAAGRVPLFTAEEYVRTACDFLERIPGDVVIQRLVGDTTSKGVLIAPCWTQSKTEVLRLFSEEFARRGSRQGGRVGRAAPAFSRSGD
jgi:hypothetical protein